MTPQQLLSHQDDGRLWPEGADPAATLPEAYALALQVRALRLARGEVPRGYKVGFTNRGIWARYQVFAPIWGTVWNTTLVFCEGQGRLNLAHCCQPRIEPEAVFRLKGTPRPGAGMDELFEALDWVAPGFEIVQSHCAGWKFTPAQTVADSALHARLLVGPRQPVAALARSARELHELLAGLGVVLQRDGSPVDQGKGSNVLDSPLAALQHFAAELAACPGAPALQAGDVVTTGTWTDAFAVQPGQRWRGEFAAPLGPLEVLFD